MGPQHTVKSAGTCCTVIYHPECKTMHLVVCGNNHIVRVIMTIKMINDSENSNVLTWVIIENRIS